MATNRVKDADQPWCVYGHYEGNDLVYIGSGTLQRAMDFSKDKRDELHYNWYCTQILSRFTDFVRILEITPDYDEVRFIEGRLIAEYKPRFNKNLNKVTFKDLKETITKMRAGKSLRQCAVDVDIYHNNLRVLLLQPYCENDYSCLEASIKANQGVGN